MKRQSERSYLYGLADPDTGVIRYIGQSLHPRTRLSQHITTSYRGYLVTEMHRWIQALLQRDTKPQLIILGIFSPNEIASYEDQMIWLLNNDGNKLFNNYKASGVGYRGQAQRYTVQCIETGEEFPTYAAAGRAYGYNARRVADRCKGMRVTGLHFRRIDK